MVREATPEDIPFITNIYNYYIHNSVITFEVESVEENEMSHRVFERFPNFPWLVYEDETGVLGYCYAMPWKARAAYKQTCEISVYLDHRARGKGLGTKLYLELFKYLEKMNMHVIIGGVALPNEASVVLHEKLGFEKVAHFKEVGYKHDTWVDVAYWQKVLKES